VPLYFLSATFRSSKAGVKLHTQLDLKTSIPKFNLFSNAPLHDVNALDVIHFEANGFYVIDRGFFHHKSLQNIHTSDAFYIARAEDNVGFKRAYCTTQDNSSGIVFDQIIMLINFSALKDDLKKIRRIKFKDWETGNVFVF